MKKKLIPSLILVASLMGAQSASADPLACEGKLNYIGLSVTAIDGQAGTASGVLTLDIGYGKQYICSLTQDWAGTTPAACKQIYGLALWASAMDKKVTMHYEVVAGRTCSSFVDWQTPNPVPYHFSVQPLQP
jgi:hypothetical protein